MENWTRGFLVSAVAALLVSGAMRATDVAGIPLFLAYVWLAISIVGAVSEHFEFTASLGPKRAVSAIFTLCITFLIDTLFGGVLLGGSWGNASICLGGALLCLMATYWLGKRRLRA